MKKSFLVLACLCISVLSFSQVFFDPVEMLHGQAIVTTVTGKEIKGELVASVYEARGLGSFKIKDSATGEDIKFTSLEVKQLRVVVNHNSVMEKLGKQTKSLFGLRKGTENILERDYIVFDQVTYPETKDKVLLLELINSGFSSKIQVYDHRVGTKTKDNLSFFDNGEESKSYISVVNGEASFVEKKKYKALYFDKLFASCPELMAMTEKEAKFEYFSKHVFAFDKNCK